jgi:hypothetical protein
MATKQKRALFTRAPRRLSEVGILDFFDNLKLFTIERTIILSRAGFINFVSDMTVERLYLKRYRTLCKIDDQGVWHCLFVALRGFREGLLVMVDDLGIPNFVALFWKKYIQ